MESRALSDLKIVEYADFISGPFCSKLMADMGAEVIKIEKPGIGDTSRKNGPFLNDIPHHERSGLFLYLNTNKLGITLNPETVTGANIFKELIKDTDILVENSSPGRMEQLGLGYNVLKQINPCLIMTSITPFGQTGPYRDYKSCDLISFHMGGPGYSTPMDVEDPDKDPPLKPGGHQADFITGMTAAIISLSAAFGRQGTGIGKHIDLSEHETVAFSMARDIATYSFEGIIPKRIKAGLSGFGTFVECKDGFVQIYCTNENQWNNFIEVMGNPEWANDDLFKDSVSRSKNWDKLEPLLLKWTMERTKDEIFLAVQKNHVSCAPINTMHEVFQSRQLNARNFFMDVYHPETGSIKYPGNPAIFSKTPGQIVSAAPLLGQHNEEIFCKRLNFSKQNLVKLRQAGVI